MIMEAFEDKDAQSFQDNDESGHSYQGCVGCACSDFMRSFCECTAGTCQIVNGM